MKLPLFIGVRSNFQCSIDLDILNYQKLKISQNLHILDLRNLTISWKTRMELSDSRELTLCAYFGAILLIQDF